MIYCFDIDNTICRKTEIDFEYDGNEYEFVEPIQERIDKINKLYDNGHTIIFNTSRGYVTGIDHSSFTETQLNRWGVKYHKLLFTKPYADVYVDDHAVNDMVFFA